VGGVGRSVIALAVVVVAVQGGTVARADTAAFPDSPDLPWTNPSHQSSLEVTASAIASTIANRQVTVRCEGDTDWAGLVERGGGDPTSELGFVGANYSVATGQLVTLSSAAELAGSRVCLPLKRFAVATTKPTKCFSVSKTSRTVLVAKRVKVTRTTVVAGKRRVKVTWVTRDVPTKVVTSSHGPVAPCYPWTETVGDAPPSFWQDYERYSVAILTLAHEAIHLGGIVGGRGPDGTTLGDPLAEAKANCYGMQWMPWVAQQLGDAPDDARAIARYFFYEVYPRYVGSPLDQYWSPECRAGGALDLKLPGPSIFD